MRAFLIFIMLLMCGCTYNPSANYSSAELQEIHRFETAKIDYFISIAEKECQTQGIPVSDPSFSSCRSHYYELVRENESFTDFNRYQIGNTSIAASVDAKNKNNNYGDVYFPPAVYAPACAENGSCYGDISSITSLPKTTHVGGYYRKNGTYVRGHYRSRR